MPPDESRPVQAGVRATLEWVLDGIMILVLVGAAIRTHREFVRVIVGAAVALILFSWFLRLRRLLARKQAHSPEESG